MKKVPCGQVVQAKTKEGECLYLYSTNHQIFPNSRGKNLIKKASLWVKPSTCSLEGWVACAPDFPFRHTYNHFLKPLMRPLG